MAAAPKPRDARPQNMFFDQEWARARRQPEQPSAFYVENGAAVMRAFSTIAELADHLIERAQGRPLLAPVPRTFGFPDFDTIQGFGVYLEDEKPVFATVAIQGKPAEHLIAALAGASFRAAQRRAA